MHEQSLFEKIDQIDYLDLNEYNFIELLGSSNSPVYSYEHQQTLKKIAIKEKRYKIEDETYLIRLL